MYCQAHYGQLAVVNSGMGSKTGPLKELAQEGTPLPGHSSTVELARKAVPSQVLKSSSAAALGKGYDVLTAIPWLNLTLDASWLLVITPSLSQLTIAPKTSSK